MGIAIWDLIRMDAVSRAALPLIGDPERREVGRRAGVSERGGARNERDEQRRELEAAGWELVERGGGKTTWRNPRSGGLYPQSVAISMVREEPSPRLTEEAPGNGG